MKLSNISVIRDMAIKLRSLVIGPLFSMFPQRLRRGHSEPFLAILLLWQRECNRIKLRRLVFQSLCSEKGLREGKRQPPFRYYSSNAWLEEQKGPAWPNFSENLQRTANNLVGRGNSASTLHGSKSLDILTWLSWPNSLLLKFLET